MRPGGMEDYVEGPNPIRQYLEMKGLQPDEKFKKVDSIATGMLGFQPRSHQALRPATHLQDSNVRKG